MQGHKTPSREEASNASLSRGLAVVMLLSVFDLVVCLLLDTIQCPSGVIQGIVLDGHSVM
jgi:hypothetical protein